MVCASNIEWGLGGVVTFASVLFYIVKEGQRQFYEKWILVKLTEIHAYLSAVSRSWFTLFYLNLLTLILIVKNAGLSFHTNIDHGK